MAYEIDQSGKVEDSSKPTVIAISDTGIKPLVLGTREKRILILRYRKLNTPRVYIVQVFAALIYIFLERNNISRGDIMIDIEYSGLGSLIKSNIIKLGLKRKFKINPNRIDFCLVGKKSLAHIMAINCLRKKTNGIQISLKELEKYLKLYV